MSRNDPISVGNRRLLALCDLLDSLPDERFCFRYWVDDETYKGKANLSCGTTACAFGWATTMPSLRRLGLRLKRKYSNSSPEPIMVGDTHSHITVPGGYEDCVDRAGKAVFALERADVEKLFVPDSYGDHGGLSARSTRKEVSAHIRAFVAKRLPPPTKREAARLARIAAKSAAKVAVQAP